MVHCLPVSPLFYRSDIVCKAVGGISSWFPCLLVNFQADKRRQPSGKKRVVSPSAVAGNLPECNPARDYIYSPCGRRSAGLFELMKGRKVGDADKACAVSSPRPLLCSCPLWWSTCTREHSRPTRLSWYTLIADVNLSRRRLPVRSPVHHDFRSIKFSSVIELRISVPLAFYGQRIFCHSPGARSYVSRIRKWNSNGTRCLIFSRALPGALTARNLEISL